MPDVPSSSGLGSGDAAAAIPTEDPGHGDTVRAKSDRPGPPADSRRRFLPEVQFLRAVSVLLVVVYHLAPGVVPGGFVGVDTFFVISGFLITGNMVREVHRTGRLSLAGFWAARARRILPAGLSTILVTCLVSLLLLPATRWSDLGRQALGSALYVQNWVLAAQSVDYLAAANVPTPLQHFWSLAVEEQFYLVWPVLLALVVLGVRRAARRRGAAGVREGALGIDRARRVDRALLIALAVVTAASLAFNLLYTAPGRPESYFITPTRLWELAAGGILGIVLRHTDRHSLVRRGLVLAGVGMILVAAVTYSDHTVFPGWAALLPVTGALLVIAGGRTHGAGSLTWLVDRRPVQRLGDISYSLYLWHWPFIVWWTALRPQPLWWEPVLVAAASIAAAAFSYYVIEQPFRRPVQRRRWPTLVIAATASLVVATVGSLPASLAGWQARQRESAAAALPPIGAPVPDDPARSPGSGTGPQDSSADGRSGAAPTPQAVTGPVVRLGADSVGPDGYQVWASEPHTIVPDPVTAGDQPRQPAGCSLGSDDPNYRECVFGPADADFTIALVGDSHAGNWYPALDRIAQARHWRVITYLHNSCPFSTSTRVMEAEGHIVCKKPNALALERILERHDVDAVLTTAFTVPYEDDGSDLQAGAAGFISVWKKLNNAGIKVVAIRDTPGWTSAPRECVAQNLDDPTPCTRPMTNGPDPLVAATRNYSKVPLIDMNDKLVIDGRCPAVIGNLLVYRDQNHLTVEYSQSLAPYLATRLDDALTRAGTTG